MLNRRALIGGAGIAAVIVAGSAAVAAGPAINNELEQHWLNRCAAFREIEADPDCFDQDVSAAYWARIDAAEIAIVGDRSGTKRAAELQLWVAWSHAGPSCVVGRVSEMVQQGDLAALRAIYPGLDWHEKALFAAIANLRAEG